MMANKDFPATFLILQAPFVEENSILCLLELASLFYFKTYSKQKTLKVNPKGLCSNFC